MASAHNFVAKFAINYPLRKDLQFSGDLFVVVPYCIAWAPAVVGVQRRTDLSKSENCLPGNSELIGTVVDVDDGEVWKWRYKNPSIE
jgi:hypothetical protein